MQTYFSNEVSTNFLQTNTQKVLDIDGLTPNDGMCGTLPGIKLLPVCMKGPVEMISDKIFCLNFSGTKFGQFVPIHNNIHQQSGAAAHGDRMEGGQKQKFCPFHSD